ncbi:MAG: amidohydrolase [Bacteriovoracia bacterium]
MRKAFWSIVPFVVFLVGGGVGAAYYSQEPGYDRVISRVKLWTAGADSLGANAPDAVAIRDGRVARLGRSAELEALCVNPCVVEARPGEFLMPGLHDAHAHPMSGGAGFFRAQVSGSDVEQIVRAIREYAVRNPGLAWIRGRGWSAAGFGDRLPTRQDLDRAEVRRPIVLSDSDGHSTWVNTAALTAAGVTRETKDPEGGKIVRDGRGEPTGVFLENASALIYDKIPPATDEMLRTYILKGQEVGVAAGYTAFQGGPVSLDAARVYRELDREGKLLQRAFLWADLEASDEDFEKWLAFARELPAEGRVQLTAFKGFVDGVVTTYTAALVDPYADKADTRGEPALRADRLHELVLRANRAGYPAALHAIGDQGVRMSLDAFAAARRILGENHALRGMNRVEHIEVVHPADIPRFGELNVVASMQPTHMHFGSMGSFYYRPRLGEARLPYVFAWNQLVKGGALLNFGTDYPVVDQDPIEGIYCAIQRRFGNGNEFEPRNKVDPETALRAYTQFPAESIGWGGRLGEIKVGQWADLVAFARDPRTGSQSLSDNPPLRRWVGWIK